jgi:hypothetical protein
MGSPGVFLGHLCPYPKKTVPKHLGMGICGHGHGFWLRFCVSKGIMGYRILSHKMASGYDKKTEKGDKLYFSLATCNKTKDK